MSVLRAKRIVTFLLTIKTMKKRLHQKGMHENWQDNGFDSQMENSLCSIRDKFEKKLSIRSDHSHLPHIM